MVRYGGARVAGAMQASRKTLVIMNVGRMAAARLEGGGAFKITASLSGGGNLNDIGLNDVQKDICGKQSWDPRL